MRGEQSTLCSSPNSSRGSPPLARGTELLALTDAADVGITPACAGNRPARSSRSWLRRDHPRLRGEQKLVDSATIASLGSPPLARGTAVAAADDGRAVGITPACAGNSPPDERGLVVAEDHPRLRGEQLSSFRNRSRLLGSPPLARGTGTQPPRKPGARGITPACAGNSSRPSPATTASRDHPRLRGEQNPELVNNNLDLGSPPLARGTVPLHVFAAGTARITPACAGNSRPSTATSSSEWDHPRLRGEQIPTSAVGNGEKGSPPLARGTARQADPEGRRPGITPACAGNS